MVCRGKETKTTYLTKGMKIIMKRQKKIIVSILAAAFVIGGTTCYADSVSKMLYTNETHVTTDALGNSTGKYRIVANNNKKSEYAVEVYLFAGKTSSNLPFKATKIVMGADNTIHDETVKVSRKDYPVARAYIYGNNKLNPKKGCIAATTIMNK